MVNARIGIAAASVAVVAGGLLTAAVIGASAAGAVSAACVSSGKCYATAVSPQSAVAGLSQEFTFTVTNEATTQTLGSIQITAPAGYVVTSAPGAASQSTTSATFLNLGLQAGQQPPATTTLIVYATAPCSGGGSSWSVEAKQSNQFNGSGNDFVLDTTASPLAAAVTGSCSLKFVSEPAGGVAGSPITAQVGQAATTSPVSVEVLAGDNTTVVTSSNALITMNIGANPNSPTPVTLSGTTQVQASLGVANFSNVIISQTGWPYTLVATSPGITQATSSNFGIYGGLQGCLSGPCSGSSQTKTTTGTVTTTPTAAGQFLGVGLGGIAFGCGGSYQPSSDPLNFDVLNPSGATSNALFTVTLELSKQLVQSSGHPGASSWEVCFGSNVPFTALPDTSETFNIVNVTPAGPVTNTFYTGLLPDCPTNTPPNTPCVLSRNKDNAGDVIVTFMGYGDSWGRA